MSDSRRPWLWRDAIAEDAAALTWNADGPRRLDYRQLRGLVARCAGRLQRAGIGRGHRVAVATTATPSFVVLVHALQARAAVLVAMDPRASQAETEARLRLVRPRLRIEDAREFTDDDLGEPGGGRAREPAMLRPQATAAILFTSGSSGEPKGVMLSAAAFEASARASAARLGHGREDVWLAALPPCHVGGLSVLVRACLDGACVRLASRFDAAQVAEALVRGEVTMVSVVPTMLAGLLDVAGDRPISPRVRCLLVGGAALDAGLARRALAAGWPVASTYGLTEACSQVATSEPGGAEPGVCGPPLAGTELRIGDGGEILVRSASLFRGYYRRPGATRRALREGWLHTGDIGSLRADGSLEVFVRRSDLIVSGGENVRPGEVEAVLAGVDGVSEVAVFGVADARWGQKVVALVARVRTGDAAVCLVADLDARCREALSPFKRPRAYGFVAALPRTASGKVARADLLAVWSDLCHKLEP